MKLIPLTPSLKPNPNSLISCPTTISIQMKLQARFADHLPITDWNSCSFVISIKNVDYNFALERQAEERKDKYHTHMHRLQLKMYCEFKIKMGTNLANFHSHFIPLLTVMTYTFTGKNSILQLPLLLNIHIWTSNSHTVSSLTHAIKHNFMHGMQQSSIAWMPTPSWSCWTPEWWQPQQ